ncbi:hypothetical protein SS1G_10714 [Sclerotinia sclerotiorum 1980 UF-70]|uniref:HTH psq-type domain-containing protein n=1 Tax=Sclerotinia sclerotiorum (strain ATCC 18683 / 1980 / Ss-1) TaxID=665079 RepID=A7EZE7_SCLS1|nr:hypothetical protein SS1G_10714 [Sclerotinia sclerotiorum 1980 UF-70]EDN94839.1 hypothetical protein SS1G_10714 [Sclerotinia sclerotiorum 1980 UF-70]
MESNNQKGRILLAIEAINKEQKLSIRKIAKLYNIPRIKIQRRMDSTTPRIESRANSYNLIKLEEEVLIQYIIDIDKRGALCKDPKFIEEWFGLVSNIQAKYDIVDSDFYNFDEIGFIIGTKAMNQYLFNHIANQMILCISNYYHIQVI